MQKRYPLAALLILYTAAAFGPQQAQATLIGDDISLQHFFDNAPLVAQVDATVQAGPAEFNDLIPSGFNINVESTHIIFSFSSLGDDDIRASFLVGTQQSFRVFGLDWVDFPLGEITGTSLVDVSNVSGIDATDLTFGPHFVELEVQSSVWGRSTNGSSITVLLSTTHPPIPEPVTATLGLMGLAVLGIATRRRVA